MGDSTYSENKRSQVDEEDAKVEKPVPFDPFTKPKTPNNKKNEVYIPPMFREKF